MTDDTLAVRVHCPRCGESLAMYPKVLRVALMHDRLMVEFADTYNFHDCPPHMTLIPPGKTEVTP